MPVDSLHPDVSRSLADWQTVRDCIAGQSTIKAAGKRYLPKPEDMEKTDYDNYLCRAMFFNATARTHEAMNGLLFRKPPTMDLGDTLEPLVSDATLDGTGFVGYAREVVGQVTSVGRGGTLVDYSDKEKRPYFCLYRAEDIINWHFERVRGRTVLTLLVLRETAYEFKADDPFEAQPIPQWRELRIVNPASETPTLTCNLWRKNDKGEAAIHETVLMKRREQPIPEIPFVFHNADAPGPAVGKIPLVDLANANVAHYRNSADIENGRHICGTPTPYAFGLNKHEDDDPPPVQPGIPSRGNYRPTAQKLVLGASRAWTSPNADAKVGFLEFTGSGLQSLKEGIEEKKSDMAALGARLIEPRTKDAEAYETVALRATAEASTLARIGLLTTEGLVWALAWAAWWMGTAENVQEAADGVEFALNKDFVSSAITPEMLTAIVAARQAGRISQEAFFFNLEKGEFFPEGWTQEDEDGSIEENPPMPAPLPTDPNTIDPETGKPFPPQPPAPKPAPAK